MSIYYENPRSQQLKCEMVSRYKITYSVENHIFFTDDQVPQVLKFFCIFFFTESWIILCVIFSKPCRVWKPWKTTYTNHLNKKSLDIRYCSGWKRVRFVAFIRLVYCNAFFSILRSEVTNLYCFLCILSYSTPISKLGSSFEELSLSYYLLIEKLSTDTFIIWSTYSYGTWPNVRLHFLIPTFSTTILKLSFEGFESTYILSQHMNLIISQRH